MTPEHSPFPPCPPPDSTDRTGAPDRSMASQQPLLLCLCIALTIGLQLVQAQHWSHGWYPGGKRDISGPQSPEVSEDIKLCDGADCAYLTIPREKIVKTLLVSRRATLQTQGLLCLRGWGGEL
ncbi:hypothetical protein lerEdw1_019940 [Lerista edwardsae]|nr:hypothetical protein lerEdw1_019940 [Lerista edwardsae]